MSSSKWYEKSGQEGDVAISTRVRLARNLNRMPFPSEMNLEQKAQVVDAVCKAAAAPGSPVSLQYVDMAKLPQREALSLVEHHLISPEFSRCEEGAGLLLSKDEDISLMINEEDHLRIQTMVPGLELDEAYRLADELDSFLDRSLHFAFDDRLGYLTQCPTNLGTGMRASIMLHLPALQDSGAIQQLANTVAKLGLTIRGMYGEGSKPDGAIYQLSNQVTLGISESSAIQNLKGIAAQIIRQERGAREELCRNPHFEDRVWRSLGILQTARLLNRNEFMALISNVREGVALDMIPGVGLDRISGLINAAQPATLMAEAGEDLDPSARDALRAKMVREQLAGCREG